MTAEVLYGTGGLVEHLTTFGDGAIDINYADEIVIQSLDERIDLELAKLVVERRTFHPFEDIAELKTIPGMSMSIFGRISGAITTNPRQPVYYVTCTGKVGHHEKLICAMLQKDKNNNQMNIIWYTE